MATTMMSMILGCGKYNKEAAEEVCKALKIKYGNEFVAKKIGDRWATDSAQLYVCPEDDEDIVFTAKINSRTREVEDDYLIRRTCYIVEEAVQKAFLDQSLTASARCNVVTSDPLDVEVGEYTPGELMAEYGFDHYTLYLTICNENVTAERILDAMKGLNKAIDAKIVSTTYVLEPEGYQNCIEKMKEFPDVSLFMIEKNKPGCKFYITVEDGSCSLTAEELAKEIER